MSAQPCGCDQEAKHQCDYHQAMILDGRVPLKLIEEIRVTDPKSGGQKGKKKQRFSLIPQDWLWALAEHYGKGAEKYDDNNWRKGYAWSLSVDAHHRHVSQWLQGHDDDVETGTSHLVAAAWHLVALWWFHQHGKGTDDVRHK